MFLTPSDIALVDSTFQFCPSSTMRAFDTPHNRARPRPVRKAVPSERTPIPTPSISFSLSTNREGWVIGRRAIAVGNLFTDNELEVIGADPHRAWAALDAISFLSSG